MESACRRPASKSLSSRSGRPRLDASYRVRFVTLARHWRDFPHRQVNACATHASRSVRRAPRTWSAAFHSSASNKPLPARPGRDRRFRPTNPVQSPPATGPVRSALLHGSFAIRAMGSPIRTRCQQSARKPRWPDFSATPPRGESLASPSLGIDVLGEACHSAGHPFRPPDLPSLPHRSPFSRFAPGSSFRARSVRSGLQFLKPLGTICSMA